jgi:hypothetical protein
VPILAAGCGQSPIARFWVHKNVVSGFIDISYFSAFE